MRISRLIFFVIAGLLAAETVHGQETAFTYQGRLNNGTNPANGRYNLVFTVYAVASKGSIVAGPITNSAVGVSNGLFAVTLDFGNGVFDGNPRWLEIGVATNGSGVFTELSPRQPLTPTPYAMFANNASNLVGHLPAAQISGTLSSAQISGTYSAPVNFGNPGNTFSGAYSGAFAGNGAGLTNVNASTFGGLAPASYQPALGFTPLTPQQTTNAANVTVQSATNAYLETSTNIAQAIVRPVTNALQQQLDSIITNAAHAYISPNIPLVADYVAWTNQLDFVPSKAMVFFICTQNDPNTRYVTNDIVSVAATPGSTYINAGWNGTTVWASSSVELVGREDLYNLTLKTGGTAAPTSWTNFAVRVMFWTPGYNSILSPTNGMIGSDVTNAINGMVQSLTNNDISLAGGALNVNNDLTQNALVGAGFPLLQGINVNQVFTNAGNGAYWYNGGTALYLTNASGTYEIYSTDAGVLASQSFWGFTSTPWFTNGNICTGGFNNSSIANPNVQINGTQTVNGTLVVTNGAVISGGGYALMVNGDQTNTGTVYGPTGGGPNNYSFGAAGAMRTSGYFTLDGNGYIYDIPAANNAMLAMGMDVNNGLVIFSSKFSIPTYPIRIFQQSSGGLPTNNFFPDGDEVFNVDSGGRVTLWRKITDDSLTALKPSLTFANYDINSPDGFSTGVPSTNYWGISSKGALNINTNNGYLIIGAMYSNGTNFLPGGITIDETNNITIGAFRTHSNGGNNNDTIIASGFSYLGGTPVNFAYTNANNGSYQWNNGLIYLTNTGGMYLIVAGGAVLASNSVGFVSSSWMNNGTNVPGSTVYSSTASLLTMLSSNAAPYLTSSNPTNQFTTGVLYTNGPSRGILDWTAVLTSASGGSANITLYYTNDAVGYVQQVQVGAGAPGTTPDYLGRTAFLSPNATFQWIGAFDTGASGWLTNAVLWQE